MQDPSTAFQGIRPPTGATAQFSAAPDQHQQMQQQQQQQEQHLKCPRCDSTNTKFCYYNNYNLSQPRHFCKSCRRYWTKGGALRNIPVGGGTRKNSKRSSSNSSNGGRGGGSASNSSNNHPLSIGSGASNAKRPNTSGSTLPTQMPAAPLALSHLSFAPRPTMHHHLPKPELLPPAMYPSAADQERQLLDIGGSFSSLLTSSGHFGSLIDHTSFHTVAGPGAMTLPVTGDLGCPIVGSGLELLGPGNDDDNENPPQTQNPDGAVGTSSGAENFLGLHGVSGCWDGDGGPDGGVGGGGGATGAGGGGWPGLSIYTPGSSFR